MIPRGVYHSLVLSQYFGTPVQAIFQKDADPGNDIKGKREAFRHRFDQTAYQQIKKKPS